MRLWAAADAGGVDGVEEEEVGGSEW